MIYIYIYIGWIKYVKYIYRVPLLNFIVILYQKYFLVCNISLQTPVSSTVQGKPAG